MKAKVIAESLSGFLNGIKFNPSTNFNQSLYVKEKIKLILDTLDEELLYPPTFEEFMEALDEYPGKSIVIGSPYGEYEFGQGEEYSDFENDQDEDQDEFYEDQDEFDEDQDELDEAYKEYFRRNQDEDEVENIEPESYYEANETIEENIEWFRGFYKAIELDKTFSLKSNQILLLNDKLNDLITEMNKLEPYIEDED